jgi:hypothetical protein
MTAPDWVKLLNLCGGAFLFFSSLRAQRWTRQQADAQARVADSKRKAAKKHEVAARTERRSSEDAGKYVSQEALDEQLAVVISGPYFDTRAFFYLCIGFFVSTVAAAWDFISSGALSRTFLALVG